MGASASASVVHSNVTGGISIKLKIHQTTLRGENVTLRPMTEKDWAVLLRWNSDPEVLYYAEGEDVQSYSLDDIQRIYRKVSQTAFCFIIEADGTPIGESWLQQMNLDRILHKYPGRDCRRIDLMIGDKAWWGRGVGTKVIRMLTAFAFEREGAAFVFGCDIADYNAASLRAFEKAGYEIEAKLPQPAGEKAAYRYDVRCSRAAYRSVTG